MKKNVYVVVEVVYGYDMDSYSRFQTTRSIGVCDSKEKANKLGQNHVRKELATFLNDHPHTNAIWDWSGSRAFVQANETYASSDEDFDMGYRIEEVPYY